MLAFFVYLAGMQY